MPCKQLEDLTGYRPTSRSGWTVFMCNILLALRGGAPSERPISLIFQSMPEYLPEQNMTHALHLQLTKARTAFLDGGSAGRSVSECSCDQRRQRRQPGDPVRVLAQRAELLVLRSQRNVTREANSTSSCQERWSRLSNTLELSYLKCFAIRYLGT